MKATQTVIIGGGQAGLALSRCLTERGVRHVVLERGRIGQRWSERWDSLRLLSPNSMTRLPHWSGKQDDPDGFMTRDGVLGMLNDYARSFDAPVEEMTEVRHVDRFFEAWRVVTNRGMWLADNVVIATGHCQETRVPEMAANLSPQIVQVTTSSYRNPHALPNGDVLIVGASASGIQLADEIVRSGRQVVLAVGSHTRLPRRYRGRDIFHWLDRIGTFDRPLSDMSSPADARCEESLQLVGGDETLDLEVLARRGVSLAGRVTEIDGVVVKFADDLRDTVAAADVQLKKLLSRIDRHIDSHGLALPAAAPIVPVPSNDTPRKIDLETAGIRTVLWATGYKRSYPWLHAKVLDDAGELIQTRGRTAAPGLYALGLQFMIRRNSSFLHGIGIDAAEIASAIAGRMERKEAA